MRPYHNMFRAIFEPSWKGPSIIDDTQRRPESISNRPESPGCTALVQIGGFATDITGRIPAYTQPRFAALVSWYDGIEQ